jgi:outer membrane receptor for ferrienterochelin and colicin
MTNETIERANSDPNLRRQIRVWRRGFLICVTAMTMSIAYGLPGITGILEGKIVDKASKEPIVGVNVFIVGTQYGTTSNTDGSYRISNVRGGEYDVRFNIIGYKTLIMKSVVIAPDLRTRINVELEVGAVEFQPVEIVAKRPLIQKDLAATAFSIGGEKVEKLPIATFNEVLSLQPGTTLEGNVRGGSANGTVFLIDGIPVQDVIGGGLGTDLPKSSISDITILTGGLDAEYGNTQSGAVNVITKTGGNESAVGVRLERDNWLPGDWNKQQNRATEFEVSANGPVIVDKLYYFTANVFDATDTRWWQDFQNFFPSPISRQFKGFTKFDFVASPSSRWSLQGIYSIERWHDYEFSWRYDLTGLPARARDSYRIALVNSGTLSENLFYTVSLSQFYQRSHIGPDAKTDLSTQPYQYDFFLQYIVDGQRSWWAESRQRVYNLKADLTAQIGERHVLKAGVDVNQYDIYSDLVKYEPQTTYFGKPILDAPLLNYSNSYHYLPRSGGIYVQDKIQHSDDGSNLSFGIRWDFLDPTATRPLVEYIPTGASQFDSVRTSSARATIKQQFSPRISLSAPMVEQTFFFINLGFYFQYPLFDYLYSGINPEILRGLQAQSRNVLAGNPDLQPERTISWELGLKREINENTVASITYFNKQFRNQIDAKTLIPFDSKAAGDYGFASYVNNAQASAYGLEFVLTRQNDPRLSGSISYSYMVTEGLTDYVNQGIQYAQWGFPIPSVAYPLSWDEKHTIKADVEVRIPGGIRSDWIVLYNSPRPYTYFPTRDGFTPIDTSKAFVPNNRRMYDVLIVNAKLSRRFTFGDEARFGLTLYADITNLLNRANVRWMDSNGRIGGELGDPGAYYEPRRVRIGIQGDF